LYIISGNPDKIQYLERGNIMGDKENICKCGKPGNDWDICPYDAELGDPDEEHELCNCCDDCRDTCSAEV
jgi:hypothetical protein